VSYKTVASKWMKNKELIVLGIAVALVVHFSGVPVMLVTHLGSIPFSVLMVGAGLSALVCSLMQGKRTSKTL